jgi:hypothetical protein
VLISLALLWLNISTFYMSYASNQVKPNLVPDTMPDAIQVRLDNISLCNQRNQERAAMTPPLSPLVCDIQSPQLDPTTYTMDEYVRGVLKIEAGPVEYYWHIEALKAMAVIARTFGWGHMYDRGDGTFEIGSTTSAQTFFPENQVDDEQKYWDAANLTSGQYLSHPDGAGAADVISAQYRTKNGNPTNPCSLGQGDCPTPPNKCPGLEQSYFTAAYLKGVADPHFQWRNALPGRL